MITTCTFLRAEIFIAMSWMVLLIIRIRTSTSDRRSITSCWICLHLKRNITIFYPCLRLNQLAVPLFCYYAQILLDIIRCVWKGKGFAVCRLGFFFSRLIRRSSSLVTLALCFLLFLWSQFFLFHFNRILIRIPSSKLSVLSQLNNLTSITSISEI